MSFRRAVAGFVTVAAIVLSADTLSAQQIAVQQPSFEVFSGAMSLSVPDRGRIGLGGVARGATSRSIYGPLRTNTNLGRSHSGSAMTAGVFIHDLADLDRQVLEAAEARRPAVAAEPISERAEHAYRILNQQARDPAPPVRGSAVPKSRPRKPTAHPR